MERHHPMGIVKSVQNKWITVVFSRSSACGKCEACGMLKETGDMILDFEMKDPVQVGDFVDVVVDEKFFLFSALLLYGVPLIFLIVGITVGLMIFTGENGEMLSAILGMGSAVASYFILKAFDPKFQRMKRRFMKYSAKSHDIT